MVFFVRRVALSPSLFLLALVPPEGAAGWRVTGGSGYGGKDEGEREVEAIVPNPYERRAAAGKNGACSATTDGDDGAAAPPSSSCVPDGGDNGDNDVGAGAGLCPVKLDATLLEPYYLLTHPIATQSDTFQELEYAKIMDALVPVYRMKQPARLSPAELEFRLILVRELKNSNVGIRAVDVDPDHALDSWFPGYAWSPLVMSCGAGDGDGGHGEQQQHVGWKFTAAVASNGNNLPHFYALMVEVGNKSKNSVFESVRLGGFPRVAGAWVAKAAAAAGAM